MADFGTAPKKETVYQGPTDQTIYNELRPQNLRKRGLWRLREESRRRFAEAQVGFTGSARFP